MLTMGAMTPDRTRRRPWPIARETSLDLCETTQTLTSPAFFSGNNHRCVGAQ